MVSATIAAMAANMMITDTGGIRSSMIAALALGEMLGEGGDAVGGFVCELVWYLSKLRN